MIITASTALGWILGGSSSGPLILAYLDPGGGSMLLQVTVAALFSGLFFAKSWWAYVKGRLLEGRSGR